MPPAKTTKTTKPAKGPRNPPPKPSRQLSPGLIVVIAVAAVAVVALIVVVVTQLSGGSGSDTSGLKQTQPVAVEGASLPPFQGDPSADTAVGLAPPTLEGKSFDGTPVSIIPNDGKAKLVVFFAHWCPHCQAEVPRIVQWSKEGKVPASVSVYGVATGTNEAAPNYPPSSWLQKVGWAYPTLADSAVQSSSAQAPTWVAADAYGLPSYPYFVAIDTSGKVTARITGELTEQQFTALLATITPTG